MNVLLIDIDSKIPNLALKKFEIYHKNCGHNVQWNMPVMTKWADKIYVSCIFCENATECQQWENNDKATIGGSGYSLFKKLPPEVEAVKPHINLGFTSRGCDRHCLFCIVPKKEGKFHVVGDLLDLWDGKSKAVTVMDNNILLDPDHFQLVCQQARQHKLKVDFNQGLDHRLLTDDIMWILCAIRHQEYRFAFDNIAYQNTVCRAIDLLDKYCLRGFWYVLVGFDTTFQDDLSRLQYLKQRGQTAFVQRYSNNRGNLLLGRWANRHALFKAMTFKEFLRMPRNQKYCRKYPEVWEYFGKWDFMP